MGVMLADNQLLLANNVSENELTDFIFLANNLIPKLHIIVDEFYEYILSNNNDTRLDFIKYLKNPTAEQLAFAKQRDYNHWLCFLKGSFDEEYISNRKHSGSTMAMYQLPFNDYTYSVSILTEIFLNILGYEDSILNVKNWHAFKKMLNIDSNLIMQEYIEYNNNIMIEHNNILKQLSLPISEIVDKVLYIPIIGNVHQDDSMDIVERILKVVETKAIKIVIIDIIGISNFTEHNAIGITKLYQACNLMACKLLLSGVQPQAAEIMANMEKFNYNDLYSTTSMTEALKYALELRKN